MEQALTKNDDMTANASKFFSLPKPIWPDWVRIRHCALWQAAALACDVDPSIYKPYGLTANASRDSVLTAVPSNLQGLLDLAQSAVASGTLKISRIGDATLMQSEVELSEFSTWLRMLGHRAPIEYPWIPQKLNAGAFKWPWGSYQTKELQVLALAADRFWTNYDPQDPSTAPTNDVVIAWLIEQGVSERKADVIASVLRADDLRPGPRKSQ